MIALYLSFLQQKNRSDLFSPQPILQSLEYVKVVFLIKKPRKSQCGHSLLKKCFNLYLLNSKRSLKNSNGSDFSVESTLNSVIFVKIKKPKN